MELLSYTRKPKEDMIYGCRMAYSMHLAYRGKDGKFHPFHHNEGILYARALQNPQDGTLDARCLKKPWIFELHEGGYGILAIRTGGEGQPDADSQGCVLFPGRSLRYVVPVTLRDKLTGSAGRMRRASGRKGWAFCMGLRRKTFTPWCRMAHGTVGSRRRRRLCS